ncbi:hypothetical protein [Rubrivirga sp.]|uniref:hypothetical protein n=1 Tax=Rubrivirga sp. TaxID=1885344 RepID=UPI003B51B5F1
MPRLLTASTFLLASLFVGCATDATDEARDAPRGEVEVQSNETTDVAAPDLAAEVDTTGPAQVTVAGATVPTRGVVTDIESGDVSCTLTLRTDGGATEAVHADYSVCDSNVILDRRVQIEYAPSNLLAPSCDGDPDCLDTETVALAVVADPID